MEYIQTLTQELPKLSPRMRVAFATACAERVRQLYEFLSDDDVDVFGQVLAQLWGWVHTGTSVDTGSTSAQAKLVAKYDALVDEEESGIEVDSLSSVLCAVAACTDPTTASTEDAAINATDVANASSVDAARSRQAQAEEERFQLAVLDIVRAWQGPEFDMKMFEPVGWTAEHGWPTAEWVEQYRTNPKW